MDANLTLNYKVGHIHFLYLGLPMGEIFWCLLWWVWLRWSFLGGKVKTLWWEVVLCYLNLSYLCYQFIFFHSSRLFQVLCFFNQSLFKSFIWGESEDWRKIHWIKYKMICLNWTNERLWVRRVIYFNRSLLEKWWWRMLVNNKGLWYKVISTNYDMKDDKILIGGRKTSDWWKNLINVRYKSLLNRNGWSEVNVRIMVGNNGNTLF